MAKRIVVFILLLFFVLSKAEAKNYYTGGDTLLKTSAQNLELLLQLSNIPLLQKNIPYNQQQAAAEKKLKMAEEQKEYFKAVRISNDLGLIALRQFQLQSAAQYFNKSLDYAKKINDVQGIVAANAELGFIQQKLQKFNEAISYYNEALVLLKSQNNAKGQAIVYDFMGQCYQAFNSKDLAAKCFEQAGNILKNIGYAEDAAREYEKAKANGSGLGVNLFLNTQGQNDSLKKADDNVMRQSNDNINAMNNLNDQNQQLKLQQDATTKLMHDFHLSKEQADSMTTVIGKLYADKQMTDKAMAETDKKLERQKLFKYYVIATVILLLGLISVLFWRNNYVKRSAVKLNQKNMILKQTVEQLEETARKLTQSEKFKDEFLANMSHEIRTPMNAIVGMTNLLLKTELKPEQQKYLNDISTSSENLLVIINDILDVSKIQAGKLELEKINFDLQQVVENAYTMFRYKALEKGIELSFEINDDVPNVVVGDPVRLSQILVNLIGNALKFTSSGFIKINVSRDEELNGKTIVKFDIQDSGIGIAEEYQKKIFKSFSQAASDTTRKFGGTGLGLTICKQLTELMGGYISLKSKPGEGTTFTVQIPYEIGKLDVQVNAKKDIEASTEKLSGTKILLVEDNGFNQVVAIETLKDLIDKPEIVLAVNGKESLIEIEKNNFDVVLMDIQMPEMDGYEATRKIRASKKSYSEIPIIAMTANAVKSEVEKCFECGMNDYISKPFVPKNLLDKIIKAVKLQSS